MKSISLNLIIIYIFIILSKEQKNYNNEIAITIKGKGKQNIFSGLKKCKERDSYFDTLPDEIYINGIKHIEPPNRTLNFVDNDVNNITMKWNQKLTKCDNMFNGLTNIINVDLSKFDSSSVTDMKCMFFECSGITSINFSNFNTSLVTDMSYMFSDCYSLKILDLSSFDTSLVTDMLHMFYQCFKLTSINIKNLKTSNVINMTGMFENSYSLKSLNLKNFNTSSVITMYAMFHLCTNLTSLDLSSFNTSKVDSMWRMLEECPSLKLLNIQNFIFKLGINTINMFLKTNNISYYCLNVMDSVITSSLPSSINNCTHFAYIEENKKYIIEKDEWIDECSIDDTFIFEYNKTCYQLCPKGTYNSMRNICRDLNCSNYYNYNLTGCINEIPEGYYCNDSNHKTIDKCNIKCKSCSYDSTEKDLCLSCNTINNYYPLVNYNWSNESYKQCFNFTPEGYAFEEGFYKPCYQTCKSCSLIGNKTDNKCDECISNHAFIFHEKNKNCYEKCPFYYFLILRIIIFVLIIMLALMDIN